MWGSHVRLQLEWVKPRLGLLTIHSLRLASGGDSPTYNRSTCFCNAAVLRAEEREVWWCVRERFREWGEGIAQRTGDRVNEEERKKTLWDRHYKMFVEIMVNSEHFDKQINNPGSQERFVNLKDIHPFVEGVCLARMVQFFTEYISALHGTIYQH